MKSVLLSYYNPNDTSQPVSGIKLVSIVRDADTELVTANYSDGSEYPLGKITAASAASIIDAKIVDHNLVVYFDDTTELIVGRIDPTLVINAPTPVGHGILMDASTATYKEIKSDDPAITITTTPTEVIYDVTLEEGSVALPEADGSVNTYLMASLNEYIETGTGLVGKSTSQVGWNVLSFNDVQIAGDVDVSFADGVLTLGTGTWYVEGLHTTGRAGISKAVLRNSDGEVVLESLNMVNSTATTALSNMQVKGYVAVTGVSADFTIEQYCSSVGSGFELGLTHLGGQFGTRRSVTKYNIYKVSDEPTVLTTTVTDAPVPEFISNLQAMCEQYKDRVPTVVRAFDEILYNDNAAINFNGASTSGDYVYFGPSGSSYFVEWNTVTKRKSYYLVAPPVPGFTCACTIVVGNEVFMIPLNGIYIPVFNTITKVITYETFGLTIPNNNLKWVVGAYCPTTNKIFCPPWANISATLIIDLTTRTASLNTFGLTYAALNYSSCNLVGTKLYCIPRGISNVLIIDTVAETAIQSNLGVTMTDADKWGGSVYHPATNKIVGFPHYSTDFLIIDCATDTAIRTTFGLSILGAVPKFELSGNVLPDGKILALPRDRANGQGVVIDLENNTASELILPWKLTSRYLQSVRVANKIYVLPQGSENFAIFDPATMGIVPEDSGRCLIAAGSTTVYRWFGSVLGMNGTVYMTPASIGEVYGVNVEDSTCQKMPFPLDVANTANGYGGGVSTPNDGVYFAPYANQNGLKVVIAEPGLGTPRKRHYRDHIPLVPELTGYTGPGVTVSASTFQAGYEPWRAFDGWLGGNSGTGWGTTSVDPRLTPQWLQVTFDVPTRVDVFRIMGPAIGWIPVSVTLLGSNDLITFISLGTYRPNLLNSYVKSEDLAVADASEFLHYRLVVNETDGNATTIIQQLELMQYDPAEVEYYEVHASQNVQSSSMLDITASSQFHATDYGRQLTLRDIIFGGGTANGAWVSADTPTPQWVEYRTKFPTKATAVRLANSWAYYTQTIKIEATNDGKNYVTLKDVTPVPNDYVAEGFKLAYKILPIVTFENDQEYYAYRLTVIDRHYTSAQRGASLLWIKFLTTEEYDSRNYIGRPEQVLAIYGQTAAGKWSAGIYAPENGKIYFGKAELASGLMGVLDIKNNSFTTTRLRENLGFGTQYYSYPRKNPYNDSYIFNRYTGTHLLKMTIGESGNEAIQFIPTDKDFLSISATITFPVTGVDGNSYSLARSAPWTLNVYDVRCENCYTEYYNGITVGNSNYFGGVLGPNGKMYFPPILGNQIVEVDTVNMQINTITHLDTSSGSVLQNQGAKLTRSGRVLFEPRHGGAGRNCFYYLDFGPDIIIPDEILFSPYLGNT